MLQLRTVDGQCYEDCSQWTGGRRGFSGNGGPYTNWWSRLNNSTFASRDYEMKYCELMTNKNAISLPTEAMFRRWLICKFPVLVHLINPRIYENFWRRGQKWNILSYITNVFVHVCLQQMNSSRKLRHWIIMALQNLVLVIRDAGKNGKGKTNQPQTS